MCIAPPFSESEMLTFIIYKLSIWNTLSILPSFVRFSGVGSSVGIGIIVAEIEGENEGENEGDGDKEGESEVVDVGVCDKEGVSEAVGEDEGVAGGGSLI